MDRVTIPVEGVALPGHLTYPQDATGIVAFAHGSGSSRHSPRNNYVADVLNDRGLATLLFDLLTEQEDQVRATRFDIDLLTQRLLAATDWLRTQSRTANLPLGYFGSSTGAAAALRAAATRPDEAAAVVSRGGRVDMAEDALDEVRAPSLFIVGGADHDVLALNREALTRLHCEKELEVVPDAGHLFEGPGELEHVADVAANWFESHLTAAQETTGVGQDHRPGHR